MNIKIGDTVRHNVLAHRGTGKVLERSRTFLPSQMPKWKVGFERGGPLWCYADDLEIVAKVAAPPARPTLKVVEHEPVVA